MRILRHVKFSIRWLAGVALCLVAGVGVAAGAAPDAVQVLVQTGHTLGSTHVVYSPDGRTLVSGGGDKFLKFWDVASGREFRSMWVEHTHGTGALAFSPDGRIIATSGFIESDGVKLWNAETGELLRTLALPKGGDAAIAFSPDGATLASGGSDDVVRLWDVKTGAERSVLRHSGFKASVRAVAFSPDGRMLAAARLHTVAVWDPVAGTLTRTLRGHTEEVAALAFSPDSVMLASGDSKRTIRLWESSSGKEMKVLNGAQGDLGIVTLAFSPNGGSLLASTFDGFELWDVGSGAPSYKVDKAISPVFSPDGAVIAAGASAGNLGNLGLWDAASGRALRSLNGYGTNVFEGQFAPDGRTVAAFHGNYTLTLWDVVAGKRADEFNAQAERSVPVDVDFAAEGVRVRTVGHDDVTLKVWDAPSSKTLSTLTIAPHGRMNMSPDRRTFAFTPENLPTFPSTGAARSDDTIKLWDSATNTVLHTLEPGPGYVTILRFSADGQTLLSSTNNTIKLWQVSSGKLLHTLSGHSSDIVTAIFSPDGGTVASASEDKTVKLWNTTSGKEIHTLRGHATYAQSLAFSPDGRTLASGSSDRMIKLWDTAGGQELRTLTGHSHWVTDVAFSPDGKTLFSGSDDKTFRLWRAADGAELARFINLGDRGWVVMTPEGYFNASSYEAADAVNLVQGRTVRGVAEFWDVFYRPDLVHRKLAGEDIAQDTQGITFDTAIKSPPPRDIKLTLADPAPERQSRVQVRFQVADAGGGIGEVRIFHNGKLIASDGLYRDVVGARTASPVLVELRKDRLCKAIAGEKSCSGELALEVIPGEDNEISVIAFNGENTIQSMPAKSSFTSRLAKREPQLWILPVGINEFSPSQPAFRNLGNALKDAEDFARVYAEKARSLFKPAQIHIVGSGPDGRQPLQDRGATRQAIMAQLDVVAKQAKPEDTFIWFVASHGTTDANGVFGIVPHDVRCEDARCTDIRNLITSNDILDKSKAVMAMNQLFIFDTCQSGALDNRISGLYDARMATLAKNMGLHLYASAQATEHASDSDGKGNGLFTGQLLAGLSAPEADRNQDKLITIVELGGYARKHTMALAGTPEKRGLAIDETIERPPSRPAQTQTPLIMHFGRDSGLTKLNLPL